MQFFAGFIVAEPTVTSAIFLMRIMHFADCVSMWIGGFCAVVLDFIIVTTATVTANDTFSGLWKECEFFPVWIKISEQSLWLYGVVNRTHTFLSELELAEEPLPNDLESFTTSFKTAQIELSISAVALPTSLWKCNKMHTVNALRKDIKSMSGVHDSSFDCLLFVALLSNSHIHFTEYVSWILTFHLNIA